MKHVYIRVRSLRQGMSHVVAPVVDRFAFEMWNSSSAQKWHRIATSAVSKLSLLCGPVHSVLRFVRKRLQDREAKVWTQLRS